MKKALVFSFIFGLILGFSAQGLIFPGESVCEAAEVGQLNIPVKQLRAAPVADAQVVYDIPITVELLDIAEDGNWHKVKISYAFGPFSYTYVGWTYIPVNKVLAERQAKAQELFSGLEAK